MHWLIWLAVASVFAYVTRAALADCDEADRQERLRGFNESSAYLPPEWN